MEGHRSLHWAVFTFGDQIAQTLPLLAFWCPPCRQEKDYVSPFPQILISTLPRGVHAFPLSNLVFPWLYEELSFYPLFFFTRILFEFVPLLLIAPVLSPPPSSIREDGARFAVFFFSEPPLLQPDVHWYHPKLLYLTWWSDFLSLSPR